MSCLGYMRAVHSPISSQNGRTCSWRGSRPAYWPAPPRAAGHLKSRNFAGRNTGMGCPRISKLLEGVFPYFRQSLVPQVCDSVKQSLWFGFHNQFRNGKYLHTFEVGSILPYTILFIQFRVFLFSLSLSLSFFFFFFFFFCCPGDWCLVFSVPVECPGMRIPEIFGKPVAIAIQILALMVPLPALMASFGGLSGPS